MNIITQSLCSTFSSDFEKVGAFMKCPSKTACLFYDKRLDQTTSKTYVELKLKMETHCWNYQAVSEAITGWLGGER